MGPLSVEEVLAKEAEKLQAEGQQEIIAELNRLATRQDAETDRLDKDADARTGKNEETGAVDDRKNFYCLLGKLNRAALCLSGGGIRSATFSLGVIQGLAMHAYDKNAGKITFVSGTGVPRDKVPAQAGQSMIGLFHFLSTVSGGGYIGSWLSAWRNRDDFPTVWSNLSGRPEGPDVEPPEISWLRAYSNYLTPRVGVASADAWTGVAIYLRNLLLNWLIIIPAICLVLIALKLLVGVSVFIAREGTPWWLDLIGLAGVACLILSLAFTTRHRPTRRESDGTPLQPSDTNADQTTFLRHGLAWSGISAVLLTLFFTSHFGASWVEATGKWPTAGLAAIAGALIYAAGWLVGRPYHRGGKDFIRWMGSGLIYGAMIGFGAYLFTLLRPYCDTCDRSRLEMLWTLLVPMILGVPWVLLSELAAEMIFVGLTSREKKSDADREWLGRAAGWMAATAVAWGLVSLLTLAGAHLFLASLNVFGPIVASAGGVAGIATALIGKSAQTEARRKSGKQTPKSAFLEIALSVVGPIFGAALFIVLSVLLDKILLGRSLVGGLRDRALTFDTVFLWLILGGVILLVVEWIASKNVNINRFSLHALYRNRLMRSYLGASRQERIPDQFTGFDNKDNLRMYEIWPPKKPKQGPNSYSLFHVINIALNAVSGQRLAWQERKAESFTVTPLHCGSAYKGFRPSSEYGDLPSRGGISLGTAMAISGAAASPNMGYHSSPSITLLLALFNVRLGWWLGNPGVEGEDTYQSDGPNVALKPLVYETFGLTTDQRKYVYLSDGGHFENLGLYEMVRRRCRFIVAVDSACDPDYAFEDLGNAVRKIFIDLGVRVHFDGLPNLRNRPSNKFIWRQQQSYPEAGDPLSRIPKYTIGVIDYDEADGRDCGKGYILYIKPAYHGNEGAGIKSYAAGHPTFPHETTGDQWFTESQFESYRALGLNTAIGILRDDVELMPGKLTLGDFLKGLSGTLRP